MLSSNKYCLEKNMTGALYFKRASWIRMKRAGIFLFLKQAGFGSPLKLPEKVGF